MRAIIQRVTSASVSVGGQRISSIGPGLCVLVGISSGDSAEKDAEYICRKVLNMKLWDDPKTGKPWQRSVVRVYIAFTTPALQFVYSDS
eukprot:COSAG02_NODE_7057_length_3205_cov_7.178686_5_plen_89_part_00